MTPDYQTLNDGCDGDSKGLADALGDDFEVVYENYDAQGYGHHSANAIFHILGGKHAGKYIAANCGGCSCRGTGDWYWCESEGEAMRFVPESERS